MSLSVPMMIGFGVIVYDPSTQRMLLVQNKRHEFTLPKFIPRRYKGDIKRKNNLLAHCLKYETGLDLDDHKLIEREFTLQYKTDRVKRFYMSIVLVDSSVSIKPLFDSQWVHINGIKNTLVTISDKKFINEVLDYIAISDL